MGNKLNQMGRNHMEILGEEKLNLGEEKLNQESSNERKFPAFINEVFHSERRKLYYIRFPTHGLFQ